MLSLVGQDTPTKIINLSCLCDQGMMVAIMHSKKFWNDETRNQAAGCLFLLFHILWPAMQNDLLNHSQKNR